MLARGSGIIGVCGLPPARFQVGAVRISIGDKTQASHQTSIILMLLMPSFDQHQPAPLVAQPMLGQELAFIRFLFTAVKILQSNRQTSKIVRTQAVLLTSGLARGIGLELHQCAHTAVRATMR